MRVSVGAMMALLLLIAGLQPAVAGAPLVLLEDAFETVLTRQADCDIVINPDGSVGELSIDRAVPANIRSVLDKKVRGWHFEPVLVDGQPRQAHGKMRITLAAREMPNKAYQVKVDSVFFPATITKHQISSARSIFTVKIGPPPYPAGPLKAGIEGTVQLVLRMDLQGRVQQVIAEQTALTNVRMTTSIFNRAVRAFEEAAIGTAKTWRFDVKVAPGHTALGPEDLTVRVPVRFGEDDASALWRTELRGPRRNIDWIDSQAQGQKLGVSDRVARQFALDGGPIKLTTDVVGSVVL